MLTPSQPRTAAALRSLTIVRSSSRNDLRDASVMMRQRCQSHGRVRGTVKIIGSASLYNLKKESLFERQRIELEEFSSSQAIIQDIESSHSIQLPVAESKTCGNVFVIVGRNRQNGPACLLHRFGRGEYIRGRERDMAHASASE